MISADKTNRLPDETGPNADLGEAVYEQGITGDSLSVVLISSGCVYRFPWLAGRSETHRDKTVDTLAGIVMKSR
jgi:hypothetical protein